MKSEHHPPSSHGLQIVLRLNSMIGVRTQLLF